MTSRGCAAALVLCACAATEACVPDGTLAHAYDAKLNCGGVHPGITMHCEAPKTSGFETDVFAQVNGPTEWGNSLSCPITPSDDGIQLSEELTANCAVDATAAPNLDATLVLDSEIERVCASTDNVGSEVSLRPSWSFSVELPTRDSPWTLSVVTRADSRGPNTSPQLNTCVVEAFGESHALDAAGVGQVEWVVEGGQEPTLKLRCDPLVALGCFGGKAPPNSNWHEGATLTLTVRAH